MQTLYKKPAAIFDHIPNMFCPGCGHSIICRLIAECVEELDIQKDVIFIIPIGCGGMMGYYLNLDAVSALHGRAPAVATGVKRMRPDKVVICFQGDGDLASIGTAETIHAANRGENFTTIFANNTVFGMTGGQMAPTTLVGQRSTTTVGGRDPARHVGYPLDMCGLLNQLKAPQYIERCALDKVSNIRKAKAAIKRALRIQMAGLGYSFVELLGACPTQLGLSPLKSMERIGQEELTVFPLGIYREPEEEVL